MRNHRSGMTLVEVVVAIGLFGVVMVTLFPAFLLVNRINNTSKDFTDSSYLAQQEMEYLYNQAGTKTPSELIADIDVNRGYTCTATTCTKTVGDFRYSITILPDDPQPYLANVLVVLTKLTGTDVGDRAEINYYLGTKKP